jgi:hypothetical protein
MNYIELTPAYGADYRTAKAAREAWKSGKDFIRSSMFCDYSGKPMNREQSQSNESYTLRFCNLTKTCGV